MSLQIPTLRGFQNELKGSVFREWNAGAQNVVMRLDTGGGKCLGRDTPVMMFDGSLRPVQDIRPGDKLMGPDSRARTVGSICSGWEMLYRVTPTKGDPYVVNASHVLSLKRTATVAADNRAGEIANLPVTEYLAKADRWRHVHKGWRVAVDFPTQPKSAALPPYLLGVWLGDGCSRGASVTTMDGEILNYLIDHAVSQNLQLRAEKAGGKSASYFFSSLDKRHGANTFRKALQAAGLIKNKHIPQKYKTGDRAQRLELLAGLMDTDGSYTGKGYDYISVSRQLADDVAFISRTLGFSANVSRAMKSCNGGPKAEYWRVCISGDVDAIPCKIPYKKAAPRQQKKSVLMTGIVVEPIGEGEYFGFEIDGDRLFLLGDCTVTHNTVTLASIVREHPGYSFVIAHRQELVGQLSLTLAKYGIRHRLIAAEATIRNISRLHVEELGCCYVDMGARCFVASVDTLIRAEIPASIVALVTLWVVDEGHHLVVDNKWHAAISKFVHPACKGLLPTATPSRADGKGLGRHADGVADVMVEGPPMRWLIDNGYLSDYRIICPTSDLEVLADVGASGDWSTKQLREAAKRSHIVGDVVRCYLANARGMLGITFSTDVETATEMTQAYRAAGVRAETLTGKTDDYARRTILKRFAQRQIDQIVAVDIISEGFDLPAIECASMARPTASLSLYMQQFGRTLRVMEGKGRALIMDHAANVIRHQGPPDKPREWTLDRRGSKSKGPSDAIPYKVCTECAEPFEAIYKACPHCGHYEEPAGRSSPAMVAGDMSEMSPELLASLRGNIDDIDLSIPEYRGKLMKSGLHHIGIMANVKRHDADQEAQALLRATMDIWGGARHREGMDDSAMSRLYFFKFGIDVLSSQSLKAADAIHLTHRIRQNLRVVP